MPHVDHLPLRTTWVGHGTSPFAQPVGAVTAFVQGLPARARAALIALSTRRRHRLAGRSRPRADWESLRQERRFADATDQGMLEGMQRAFDRRDGTGLGGWESR